jgi:hypothetical protein
MSFSAAFFSRALRRDFFRRLFSRPYVADEEAESSGRDVPTFDWKTVVWDAENRQLLEFGIDNKTEVLFYQLLRFGCALAVSGCVWF